VGKFLEFRLAGGGGRGRGVCLLVGAGVSVGKFLEVTLNGARVGVRIANVINISWTATTSFDMLRLAYSGL